MNELLIQTVILSAVIVVTLFVGIRITRTQQDQSTSADSESVADKYEVLQHEYSEQQELNSELKQKLASSASSISPISIKMSDFNFRNCFFSSSNSNAKFIYFKALT